MLIGAKVGLVFVFVSLMFWLCGFSITVFFCVLFCVGVSCFLFFLGGGLLFCVRVCLCVGWGFTCWGVSIAR